MAIQSEGKITEDFIAGFIDGDGSIGCNKYTPVITLTQKNKEILQQIEEKLGEGKWYTLQNRCTSLHYTGWKKVRPIAEMLSTKYLTKHRKRQLQPILKHEKIKPKYAKNINVEWLRGFAWAEGCAFHPIPTSPRYYYEITQKNKEILLVIRDFLREHKIFSLINQHKDNGCHDLIIRRYESAYLFEKLLGIPHPDVTKSFIFIDDLQTLLKKRLRSNLNRKLQPNEGKDIRYGRVKEDEWLIKEFKKGEQ